MNTHETKAQKKLSLSSETLRKLDSGSSAPAMAPTVPPGCLITRDR